MRHARRVVDGIDLGQVDATTLRRMCWLREIDEDTLQQELRRRARQGEPVAV
ncbi:MAG: hypothetical protein H6732_09380 [Alphaproteobacteria bacterium]|nr:hypothetical protein [Alphaproteobacteria bacterium]